MHRSRRGARLTSKLVQAYLRIRFLFPTILEAGDKPKLEIPRDIKVYRYLRQCHSHHAGIHRTYQNGSIQCRYQEDCARPRKLGTIFG